jgi:hypothetical protein
VRETPAGRDIEVERLAAVLGEVRELLRERRDVAHVV